ncbi:MAG: histidine kinase dimerization/phospho-acceptor domain-containing protein, partial [Anaerovorax sp.]
MNNEYEELLKNLNWQLCEYEKLLQEKDQFIAQAFHEVRNPLHSASHILNTLKETNLSPLQDDLVQTLDASFLLVNAILSGVLSLSKMKSTPELC